MCLCDSVPDSGIYGIDECQFYRPGYRHGKLGRRQQNNERVNNPNITTLENSNTENLDPWPFGMAVSLCLQCYIGEELTSRLYKIFFLLSSCVFGHTPPIQYFK